MNKVLGFALSLSVCVVGCATTPCPVPETAPVAAPQTPDDPTAISVTLISGGADPRREIHYQWVEGMTAHVNVDFMLASLALSTGGAAGGQTPGIRLGVKMGPLARTEETGLWHYPIDIESVTLGTPEELPEEEAQALAAEVAPLAEIHGWLTIDEHGHTHESHVEVPEAVTPRMRTLLANIRVSLISVPLPMEPVGPGARWEATRRITVGGVIVDQKMTYSLIETDQDIIHLMVVLHQSAAPQTVTGDAPEERLEVLVYEGTGVGSIIFSPLRVVPLSELDASTQMRARLHEGSQMAPLLVRTRGVVQVSPAHPTRAQSEAAQAEMPEATPATE